VERLLAAKADVNAGDPANFGMTPLQLACNQGHFDVVKLLLAAGADVDQSANVDGLTPLHWACNNGYHRVAELLFKHGVDVDKANHASQTALHTACTNGDVAAVKILLAAGADAEKADANGDTPLHYACHGNRVDVVKLLLEHRADVAKANHDRYTPLDLARRKGHDCIVKLLSKPRAKRSKPSAPGMSREALAEATSKADAVMAALLEGKEEANGATKKAKKRKKKTKKKPQEVGEEVPSVVDGEAVAQIRGQAEAEELPGLEPMPSSQHKRERKVAAASAAEKAATEEEQQDLMEELTVASALQGLHMTPEPEPDRKPSGEEEEEEEEGGGGWRAELTGRIEEMERRKEAAVAEEDYLTAAEIKRSIVQLVEQREALDRAVNEEAQERSSAAAGPEESDECVICMDQRKSHIVVPCGHRCVCQACAARITEEGETCPICRTAVTMILDVYRFG